MTRVWAWQRDHATAADSILAVVLLLLVLAAATGEPLVSGDRDLDRIARLLMALQAAPLALRRLAPLPVLGATTTALFAYNALGYPASAGLVAVLVAVYTVAATSAPARATVALGGSAAAVLASPFLDDGAVRPDDFFGTLLVFTVPWLAGAWVYRSRAHRTEIVRRTAEALTAERARIARELHDVVSHAISVVVVQAEAARRTPNAARKDGALDTIERTGRQALDEMRRLLSVLRTDDDADGREPQPGLDAIATLVDDVRRAGLRVELAVPSERPALGPGLELTAYRLVQESLTNVLRHAGASVARVTLGVGSGQLVVRVHDDGRGASGPADSGHGLAGMRERVAMYGGQLESGPLPEGGYAVEARLPLR